MQLPHGTNQTDDYHQVLFAVARRLRRRAGPRRGRISLGHGARLGGIQWKDVDLVATSAHLDREAIVSRGRTAVDEHSISAANRFGQPDRTRGVTPSMWRTADIALRRLDGVRARKWTHRGTATKTVK